PVGQSRLRSSEFFRSGTGSADRHLHLGAEPWPGVWCFVWYCFARPFRLASDVCRHRIGSAFVGSVLAAARSSKAPGSLPSKRNRCTIASAALDSCAFEPCLLGHVGLRLLFLLLLVFPPHLDACLPDFGAWILDHGYGPYFIGAAVHHGCSQCRIRLARGQSRG